MIGHPPTIIASARERLGDRYGETDHLLAELQKRMAEVLAQRDEAAQMQRDLELERARAAERAVQLERERARVGSSFREELDRLRDDVSRQVSAEIKNLRSARTNINAAEVLQTVTKPIERAMEFLPADERAVRVGD